MRDGKQRMEVVQALAKLKYLVSRNHFILVNRRSRQAQAITSSLAKIITNQLQARDFQKHESGRASARRICLGLQNRIWRHLYIKFKFISFHLSN